MELNLHWSLMEKLPKLERGGENRRGTSPMMGKNDSEARKLRELSNGGDRAGFLFHQSWGRTAKNSLLHLAWGRWRETWRRGEVLALALARAWPAGACPLGDGSSEHGGRLWSQKKITRKEGRGTAGEGSR
jgi:hypothetical protein